MRGAPFLARLTGGLRKPKDERLGADIAGRVESVGGGVIRLKPGDEVFGAWAGSFAEYATVREDRLVPKPVNVSYEEAAAAPVACTTALQGLRDYGKIKPGQQVLVNGASGGVGSFAVQIAKSFETEVTGVCSTRNLDMVRSIGADHVVDYTKEDFTRSGQHYDLIFDAVGNHSISNYKRALAPHGICSIAGFSGMSSLLEHAVLGPMRSSSSGKKVGLMGIAKINQKDLMFLKELLESRKVVPLIDSRYPLDKTAEAIRYLERGHARGKVIIKVRHDDGE
jgi:NADPH:quinone reductase-like Zn-dependent oxidoreductase